MIILSLAVLNSCDIAYAYDTMTSRERYRSQAHLKTKPDTKSYQKLSVIRFRNSKPSNFAEYTFNGENNYRTRLLRGLRAALLNNVIKNGRIYNSYFRADCQVTSFCTFDSGCLSQEDPYHEIRCIPI